MSAAEAVAVCRTPESADRAEELAAGLGLSCYESGQQAAQDGCRLVLSWRSGMPLGLSLADDAAAGVVSAELDEKSLRYRLRQGMRGELLIRALGRRRAGGLHVVDATAGLGRDSMVLAGAGCQVTAMECSAVVHALLADGLRRARESDDPLIRDCAGRIELRHTDSVRELPRIGDADVVFLDPMFPPRRKSARVKKEMFILQQLPPGGGSSGNALLAMARTQAHKRVVVKRPRLAEPLAGQAPPRQLSGRSSRFDIYT